MASYTEFVKGWFDQTLPANRDRVGPIALLRIDCDWYSSVRCCLDNLYDQVADRGFVVLDDYYTWDGCAIAVHEFLGKRGLSNRIESVPSDGDYESAVFRKGGFTWNWEHRIHLSAQEIGNLIPAEETFILVGQETFGTEISAGHRSLPFLERDGQYWGPPPDDQTAIREFERLWQSGATFIVFIWPAFWWLDYYQAFRQHLASNFPCVLRNDRLAAFNLKSKDKDQGPLVSPSEGS